MVGITGGEGMETSVLVSCRGWKAEPLVMYRIGHPGTTATNHSTHKVADAKVERHNTGMRADTIPEGLDPPRSALALCGWSLLSSQGHVQRSQA